MLMLKQLQLLLLLLLLLIHPQEPHGIYLRSQGSMRTMSCYLQFRKCIKLMKAYALSVLGQTIHSLFGGNTGMSLCLSI